jgi:hypothetical protein
VSPTAKVYSIGFRSEYRSQGFRVYLIRNRGKIISYPIAPAIAKGEMRLIWTPFRSRPLSAGTGRASPGFGGIQAHESGHGSSSATFPLTSCAPSQAALPPRRRTPRVGFARSH